MAATKARVPDVRKVLRQRPEAGQIERSQVAPAGFSVSSGDCSGLPDVWSLGPQL